MEYESYLNKDENKDFGKGEGGGDEGGKDEEGESSDSDNCTSDMEMFSYGCPACGAEEVSDYINCIVCASIGFDVFSFSFFLFFFFSLLLFLFHNYLFFLTLLSLPQMHLLHHRTNMHRL